MKAIFCVPFLDRPTEPFIKSLTECIPAIEAQGWEHGLSQFKGNPYISNARADMTRKALDADADVVIYLDYDVSWQPHDMVRLLSIDALVCGGTYRFKKDEVEYMGSCPANNGYPIVRKDGCIKAHCLPAGFLKLKRDAYSIFARKYPELLFGDPMHPYLDLFNHGAIEGTWYGEDYAFCKRWRETGNDLWLVPDLDLDHHSKDKVYKGNFHKYMLKENQP